MTTSEFDAYALQYDEALEKGLSISGESKEYFARERVRWMARRLAELGARPRRILDFGCGTGGTGIELLQQLGADVVVGADVSEKILAIARRDHPDPRLQFKTIQDVEASGPFDLAYCNGVFHHVEPAQRRAALDGIRRSLGPGGHFGFWENNPWNPGTRLVMSRIPFDRDAKLISAPAARRLLVEAGFRPLVTDFLFLFPRALAALRPLETRLARVPAGAQYLVLCQNSEWSALR
jgi:SAM-dependent methyltransferase